MSKPQRILREHELSSYDGLKSTRRAELIALGEYPKPIRLSQRRKAWLETEIADWQAARIAKRDVPR